MDDPVSEPTSEVTRPLENPERTRHSEGTSWIGVATEIGTRHPTNQDAYAVAVPDLGRRRAVLVVSDGVSSSIGAELASATAAAAVRDELVAAMTQGSLELDPTARFTAAYEQANVAVLANGEQGHRVGSCTVVAAVVDGTQALIGNIGDTRAYWLPDQGEPAQLSVDDSIAQAQIELGMPREEAEAGYHAHAITKWLGPEAPDVSPRLTRFEASGSGWLMICSDGLWNYASTAEAMASVMKQIWSSMPIGDPPEVLARALTLWANVQGGRDNITVALARIEPGSD